MSAADHLGPQFDPATHGMGNTRETWPIEAVGKLHSGNIMENTAGVVGDGAVPVSERFRNGSSVDDWARLHLARGADSRLPSMTSSMRDQGFDEDEPLEVRLARGPEHASVLSDGHNRYLSARQAGVKRVPVRISESVTPKSVFGEGGQ